MKQRYMIALLAISLLIAHADVIFAQQERNEKYKIRVGAVEFIPDSQLKPQRNLPASGKAVIQFYQLPSKLQMEDLSTRGITLGRYVGGNAYVASVQSNARLGDSVRAISPYTAEMKLSRHFKDNPRLRDVISNNSTEQFYVKFSGDQKLSTVLEILSNRSVEISGKYWDSDHALQIKTDWSTVEELTNLAEVEMVEPGLRKPTSHNVDLALRNRASRVRQHPDFMNVAGAVNVGVWDGGLIKNSALDLVGRVTLVNGSYISGHATAVAGVIGSNGLNDYRTKGMAPEAKLFSYDYYGDVMAEIRSAAIDHGIKISNHSWGYTVGWDTTDEYGEEEEIHYDDYWFGVYDSVARSADQLVIDSDTLFVNSAGNDRNDVYVGPHRHEDDDDLHEDLHDSDPDYGSIVSFSGAKNIVTVGAVVKDMMYTGFSSWGPVNDGRVKPDIVTVGQDIITTSLNDSYVEVDGTSFSAPGVSGAAALLYDYYNKRHGVMPSSVTMKNLLIHSAHDIGPVGVDYQNGHGAMDTHLAARVIRNAVFKPEDFPTANLVDQALIIENSVQNGHTNQFTFEVLPNVYELRVSLVWHDPAGGGLINNLDLNLLNTSNNRISEMVLNPDNPTALASAGTNSRDNVKTVKVANATPGQWTMRVVGSRVTNGSQNYSLIVSFSSGNLSHNQGNGGSASIEEMFMSSSDDFDAASLKRRYAEGDKFRGYVHLNISENPQYSNYYGGVEVRWRLLGAKGKVIMKYSRVFASLSGASKWQIRSPEFEVPSGLDKSWYMLVCDVTMANGQSYTMNDIFMLNK